MRQFDLHEFLAYIAPGTLLLVGARRLWAEACLALPLDDMTFGEFGVGIVLAYIAGVFLQTIGTGVEKLWWKPWGGMPIDWVRCNRRGLIAPAQSARVEAELGRMLGNSSFNYRDVDTRQWYSVVRQVYAAVAAAGRSARIDVFNGYYGLCRGLAATLIILLVWNLAVNIAAWKWHVALAVLLSLALYRMHRFGVHYGREVFVQFLELPDQRGTGANIA